jgi:hypothetical protein
LVRFFGADTVEELRARLPTYQNGKDATKVTAPDGSLGSIPGRKPDPMAQARADEIIAAHDEWTRAKEEARERSGLKAAEETYDRMTRRIDGLLREIVASPAVTLRGLIIKAQCAETVNATTRGWAGEIEELLEAEEGWPSSRVLSASIARDLAALAGQEGHS